MSTPHVPIDRLDVAIIRLMSQDARMGVADLAAALGVTRNTVQARLRRLADEGVLSGYRPQIDLAAVGLDVVAFMTLELVQGRQRMVIEDLRRIPQVVEVHTTTGREDLLVRLVTDSHQGLQLLIERILVITGVTHGTTYIGLSNPVEYRVMPALEDLTSGAGWGRSTPAPTQS